MTMPYDPLLSKSSHCKGLECCNISPLCYDVLLQDMDYHHLYLCPLAPPQPNKLNYSTHHKTSKHLTSVCSVVVEIT